MSLRALLLLLIALGFQALSSPLYEIAGARPDFVLIVTLLVLAAGGRRALAPALAIALLFDLASIDPAAVRLLSTLPVLAILRRARVSGHLDDAPTRALVMLAAASLSVATRVAVMAALERAWPIWRLEALSLAYTMVFYLPLARLLRPRLVGIEHHGRTPLWRLHRA